MHSGSNGHQSRHRQQVRMVRVSPEPTYPTSAKKTQTLLYPPAEPEASPPPFVIDTYPEMTPEDYRRRYGYYPSGYVNPADSVTEEPPVSGGYYPKEFIKYQETKMALPQVIKAAASWLLVTAFDLPVRTLIRTGMYCGSVVCCPVCGQCLYHFLHHPVLLFCFFCLYLQYLFSNKFRQQLKLI